MYSNKFVSLCQRMIEILIKKYNMEKEQNSFQRVAFPKYFIW